MHSVILAATMGESFIPDMVAGHSLGEFSALVANKTLSFESQKLRHQFPNPNLKGVELSFT